MTDIIRLLPDSVANQIAAGEVIQRPASVVKELVENAVDAGAKTIQIFLTQAGKNSIQISDDGCGMSETDARLAFERHATSKITSAEDLFAIHTMGFRGEALASIAAVAQIELKTRRSEEELGTWISIEGSEVKFQKAVHCDPGSVFTVKNLFFNIPARRRFLKTNATELKHIITAFQRIALTQPSIRFLLKHQDTVIYHLPPAENLHQRISGIFGKNINPQLIPIESETSIVKISGFIGKPEFARKTYGEQFFFVNNRYMKHPYFHHAVTEAYQNILPQEAIPTYFIYLETQPEKIDINIHPTKTEIKFDDERSVWQIIHATVKEALGKFNIVPSIDFELGNPIDIPVAGGSEVVHPPTIPVNPDFNPFEGPSGKTSAVKKDGPLKDWEKLYRGFESTHGETQQELPVEDADQEIAGRGTFFQFKNKYILLPVKSGLMIIDQKRAHQRVLFEEFLQIVGEQGIVQKQLFPEKFELDPADFTLLTEISDDLAQFGFTMELQEPVSVTITGIPGQLPWSDPATMMLSLLGNYKITQIDPTISPREKLVHSMASAAAIPYGKALTQEEMQDLFDRLFACQSPGVTADGKTVFTIFSMQEIENLLD